MVVGGPPSWGAPDMPLLRTRGAWKYFLALRRAVNLTREAISENIIQAQETADLRITLSFLAPTKSSPWTLVRFSLFKDGATRPFLVSQEFSLFSFLAYYD